MTTGRPSSLWRDPDKRRAALLSLVLHLAVLLLLVYLVTRPRPEPLPAYIVIDVGTPAFAEETTLAPTVESPAMQTPEPQVESAEVGDPQQLNAPQEQAAAPVEQPVTVQPPAPEAPPAAQATPSPQPTEQADVTPPPPQVQEASVESPELPLAEVPATQLPEIDPVVLQARETPAAITIPEPQAQAQIAEARTVALTPSAAVAQARELSVPEATVTVAESVSLEAPSMQSQVAESVGLATPAVSAAVAQSVPLDVAQVQAQVAPSVGLSAEGVTASVSGRRPLAPPAATAVVGQAVALDVAPTAQVAIPRPLALPAIRADVVGPAQTPGAPAAAGDEPGITDVAATALSPRAAGGNAATAGQTGPIDPAATVDGRGLAAGPAGVGAGDGAPRPPARPTFSEQRDGALAVLIDNVNGYPQSGLAEASMIIEMPVEGGLTRLMAFYDRTDPLRVGPVRSARDYFVEIAQRTKSVLVHDGGSPGAMIAIARGEVPTLNAYSSGELFARSSERSAPYNLYSVGPELRTAVDELVPERIRLVNDSIFRPSQSAAAVGEVSVSYGTYSSGFRFNELTGRYRWVRDGTPAVQPDGQVLEMQAVLVGDIIVQPIPDDEAGRLYIPIRGGRASLYLEGRVVTGSWEIIDGTGLTFVSDAGVRVDLANLRTWVVLSPSYEERVEN
ncbi:MAG TPA: DUF3048 domain-containing protein [Trueperaceae bacterium]|nr:DUF3048 domain-containing protein [Trueperaceae bacterium]